MLITIALVHFQRFLDPRPSITVEAPKEWTVADLIAEVGKVVHLPATHVQLFVAGHPINPVALLYNALAKEKRDGRYYVSCVLARPEVPVLSDRVLYTRGGSSSRTAAVSSSSSKSTDMGKELDLAILFDHLLKEGRLSQNQARGILEDASAVLASEPSLVEIADPLTIVGDVHGQLYDLQEIFEIGGDYLTSRYLFLGGFCGRSGGFSCETVLFLLALKATRPSDIWLLRGTWETRAMTQLGGARAEIAAKYGLDFYEELMDVFDRLPLAASVSSGGFRFLCVHGGLSPSVVKVAHIADITLAERLGEPRGPAKDLLWADPSPDLARDPDLRLAREFGNREREVRAEYARRGTPVLSQRDIARQAFERLSEEQVASARRGVKLANRAQKTAKRRASELSQHAMQVFRQHMEAVCSTKPSEGVAVVKAKREKDAHQLPSPGHVRWDLPHVKKRDDNNPDAVRQFSTTAYRQSFGSSPRGATVSTFTHATAMQFLSYNPGFLAVVRGHETKRGYELYRDGPLFEFPSVVSLCSAPDLCGRAKNAGAVMTLRAGIMEVVPFAWREHPSLVPGTLERDWEADVFRQYVAHTHPEALRQLTPVELDFAYRPSLERSRVQPSVFTGIYSLGAGAGSCDDLALLAGPSLYGSLLPRRGSTRSLKKSRNRNLRRRHGKVLDGRGPVTKKPSPAKSGGSGQSPPRPGSGAAGGAGFLGARGPVRPAGMGGSLIRGFGGQSLSPGSRSPSSPPRLGAGTSRGAGNAIGGAKGAGGVGGLGGARGGAGGGSLGNIVGSGGGLGGSGLGGLGGPGGLGGGSGSSGSHGVGGGGGGGSGLGLDGGGVDRVAVGRGSGDGSSRSSSSSRSSGDEALGGSGRPGAVASVAGAGASMGDSRAALAGHDLSGQLDEGGVRLVFENASGLSGENTMSSGAAKSGSKGERSVGFSGNTVEAASPDDRLRRSSLSQGRSGGARRSGGAGDRPRRVNRSHRYRDSSDYNASDSQTEDGAEILPFTRRDLWYILRRNLALVPSLSSRVLRPKDRLKRTEHLIKFFMSVDHFSKFMIEDEPFGLCYDGEELRAAGQKDRTSPQRPSREQRRSLRRSSRGTGYSSSSGGSNDMSNYSSDASSSYESGEYDYSSHTSDYYSYSEDDLSRGDSNNFSNSWS